MSHVSAAEFVRNFARFRDESRSAPLYITHHGRETHVLCDVKTWKNLRTSGASESRSTEVTLNEDMAYGLADWMDQGIIVCDQDMAVTFANRVAHGLTRSAPGALLGNELETVLPALSGSLIQMQARQTLNSGEPNMADVPSPFAPDAWLRFQSFLLHDRLVISLRDITIEMERNFKANVKEAIIEAMNEHGAIYYVRITPRGTIDRVDQPFCRLLDLPEERLIGLLLSDLVAVADKPRFRDGLEGVFRGNGPLRTRIRLLSNRGNLVSVQLSVVQLQGVYGCEGAVVVLTGTGEEETADIVRDMAD